MLSSRTPTVSSLLATTLLLIACGGGDQGGADAAADSAAAALAADTTTLIQIAAVGLETPEAVIYDSIADVYLVSNISNDALAKDDNGFISRITPEGGVERLRWINGEDEEVTLHAPKGLELKGDTLFVADIDSVRAFDRVSGTPLGARGVPGAAFLNDLAVGPDGTLYVTDSGFAAGFVPNGKDAVYRFGPDGATAVASGADLLNPNGIVAHEGDLYVVGFSGRALLKIPAAGGAPTTVGALPGGQLDGLVRMPDGSFLVSSWESSSVYRLGTDGSVQRVAENVPSPASIGWDSRRHRVLIPLFTPSGIEIRPVR